MICESSPTARDRQIYPSTWVSTNETTSTTTSTDTIEVWYYESASTHEVKVERLPPPTPSAPWDQWPLETRGPCFPKHMLRDNRAAIRAMRPRHGLE